MRVGIVIFGKDTRAVKANEMALVVSEVLQKRGYFTGIINTSLDTDKKLTSFDYLIFIGETNSFFSRKFNPSLMTYLNNCGNISGKRAATVLVNSSFFKIKAMKAFMDIIEGEGVILKTSSFVSKKADAENFAGNINVERNY